MVAAAVLVLSEIADLIVRPSVNDALCHEMQVCARIDVMRDAGGDDAEDGRGTLATMIQLTATGGPSRSAFA
jgi:hypothetical protein